MAAGRDSAASSPVRRIVITGASSGLGRTLATELALRFPGSTMLLLARRADRLAELAAECRGLHLPYDENIAAQRLAAVRGALAELI